MSGFQYFSGVFADNDAGSHGVACRHARGMMDPSVWQTPQASTRNLTCPKAGSTIALSTTSKLPVALLAELYRSDSYVAFRFGFFAFDMQYGQADHIEFHKLLIYRFRASAFPTREKNHLVKSPKRHRYLVYRARTRNASYRNVVLAYNVFR